MRFRWTLVVFVTALLAITTTKSVCVPQNIKIAQDRSRAPGASLNSAISSGCQESSQIGPNTVSQTKENCHMLSDQNCVSLSVPLLPLPSSSPSTRARPITDAPGAAASHLDCSTCVRNGIKCSWRCKRLTYHRY